MPATYATVPLLHGDYEFEPGDEIQHHYTPEALEKLTAHGHASPHRPKGVRAVYALVDNLTYHPPHSVFMRGDRIDGVIPRRVLQHVIENGEASYDKPSGA